MDVNRDNAFRLAREILADESLPGEDDPIEHNEDAYAEHVRATELAQYVLAIGSQDNEQEIKRLRSAAARALERVQVEDCGEAEMILGQVVNLDASPVERRPDERWPADPQLPAYFSRLRRTLDAAIHAADAGFRSESDDDEPPEFWSEAAREFESAARTLRSLRAALS